MRVASVALALVAVAVVRPVAGQQRDTAAVPVASLIRVTCDNLGLRAYPKTSGATGMQIYVPLELRFTYEQTREVFAYEGGGRDPFMSLLKSGDVRPLISDLRLTTVVYDGRFASRSVAVLRDITNRRIYRVKTGDIIGRLKVTQIRPREVVFTVQEFGFERQETLSLAKQEETP